MQFDRLLGFAAGDKLPFGDGVFCGPEQNWAAAYGFDGLHLSIGAHDCNHLDRPAEVHPFCKFRIYGLRFSNNPAQAFTWTIVGFGHFSLAQRKLKKEETVLERTESA